MSCAPGGARRAEPTRVRERLGIGVRQFKRLVRAWRKEGDSGLVSRQRGRPSHRRMSEPARGRIEALLRDKYPDFGATLAAEKLLERDGIKSRSRWCGGSRSTSVCGVRRPAGHGVCSSYASGVRGLAN